MSPQQGTVLTSWKEIASYLGKGVRTVQRWEGQFGLPVRRPNEKFKGVVYASRHELDRWLAIHWSQRPGKFTLAQPANGPVKMSLVLEITKSKELRIAHGGLVNEVRQSLELLALRCQELASNIARSQGLTLRPAFSLISERRSPPGDPGEVVATDGKRRG
jgi:hypothetical protein